MHIEQQQTLVEACSSHWQIPQDSEGQTGAGGRWGYLMSAHCVAFKYEGRKTQLFVILLCLTQIRNPSVGQDRHCELFVCKTTPVTVYWQKKKKKKTVLKREAAHARWWSYKSRTEKEGFPNYSHKKYTNVRSRCKWRWVVLIYPMALHIRFGEAEKQNKCIILCVNLTITWKTGVEGHAIVMGEKKDKVVSQ